MKNLNELARYLCQEETGKAEVNIAQMKQIMKCIATAMVDDPEVQVLLLKYGIKLTK